MFFSKVYGSWKKIQEDKYAAILENFPQAFSGRVFDIGSGPCFLKEFLLRKGVNVDMISADIENSENIDVLCDGSVLPFKSSCFDAVVSIDSMHLIKTRDFARVLKKNGLVLFSIFFNRENFPERKKLLESKLYGLEIISEKTIIGKENEYVVLARKVD